MNDGDGWATCTLGHRHWGVHGAAGLLVVTRDTPTVLLQHRAAWSHGGSTWGVPGGARRAAETPYEAALRETVEETRLELAGLQDLGEHVTDHGTWSYRTFVAAVPSARPVELEAESAALRWVPVDQVTGLPLHHAFAAAWPELRRLLP